jgi:SSS family solute:Na+ symporter
MPKSALLPQLAYLLALAGVAVVMMRRMEMKTVTDFFLGGRSAGPVAVGLSLFVTTLSAEWVLGSAGVSVWIAMIAGGGIGVAVWVLLPKLMASRPLTLPQFVGWRFDQRTGLMVSGASILFTLVVRIPLILLTGAGMLHRLTGFDVMTGGILLVAVSGLLVILGGCSAMLAGHAVQGVLAALGATALAVWLASGPTVPLAPLPAEQLPVLDIPWPVSIAGAIMIALWYWTADHFTVQRFLAARDARAGSYGALIAVVLVVLAAPFVFPLPLQELGGSTLPPALAGLLATVITAVVMAALTGYFHSAAALFTLDFYVARHPAAHDERLILVGRLITTLFVLISILVVSSLALIAPATVPVVQRLQLYLAAPTAALMIAVMFSQRIIARGAVAGLVVGGIIECIHAGAWLTNAGGVLGLLGSVNTVYVALASFTLTLAVVFLGGASATIATPSEISVVTRPNAGVKPRRGEA